MEFKSFPIEFESKAKKGDGTFEGRASVYGELDLGGDIVMPGAFSEVFERGGRVKILKQHDYACGIGTGIVSDSPEALMIEGELVLELQEAQDEWTRLRKGIIDGLSIGYSVMSGGEDYARGARLLRKLKLHEVSLVTFPMNTSARVTGIKQALEARFLSAINDELKAGRVLSAGNRQLVQEAYDAMGAMLAQLGKLLEESKPKDPKDPGAEEEPPAESDDEKSAREESERKAAEQAETAAQAAEAESLGELLQAMQDFNRAR